jgi:hypothetical protein
MDKDGKEKSNSGNDKDLEDTEKNPVTGVKTGEPRSDKDSAGTTENQNATDRNDKSKTATGGSKE